MAFGLLSPNGPKTKLPDNTCYGLNFCGQPPRNHSFEDCFTFFYSDLTTMGKGWISFARDTVPSWLNSHPLSLERTLVNTEIWANFLISRDLLYGLSTSPTNDKSGVEFYNVA